MLKTASTIIASSMATALLLGLAFANPRQDGGDRRKNVEIKLEWVRLNPKTSESLSLSIDSGMQGTVTKPTIDGHGSRQVMVRPTVNADGSVTMSLHIQSNTSPAETLDTVVTVDGGETKAISASSSKGEAKALKTPGEELVFVTPTVG